MRAQIDLIPAEFDPPRGGGLMLLVLNFVLRLWVGTARDRRELILENIALHHQFEVLT